GRRARSPPRHRLRRVEVLERSRGGAHDSQAPERVGRAAVHPARPGAASIRLEPADDARRARARHRAVHARQRARARGDRGGGVEAGAAQCRTFKEDAAETEESSPMIDLAQYRRFFAEEIEAVAKLQTPGLVDALASVPRERFLRPGPWSVVGDSSFLAGGSLTIRTTADADPRRVYHNIAVAIDPARHLFNGQPGTVAAWIDTLELARGGRALHVGCGLGYYTAVMAECVGATGRVVAHEVDEALAAAARSNLASRPW